MINQYSRGIILLLMMLLLGQVASAQITKYSKVRVYMDGKPITQLAALGIETDHGIIKKGYSIETDLSANEIMLIKNAGFRYDVIVDDVVAYYQQQNLVKTKQKSGNNLCKTPAYDVPQNFHLGSQAGYFTYNEMLGILDTMAIKFPNLITAKAKLDSTKTTVEGRPLYWLKITGANSVTPKPQMLYTALHHAREPGSLSQLIYYMYYLLEHYQTDSSIHYLLDHTELYFIPCVNPDGYVYNETTNPTGGGMWRKNRINNNDGTYGVDLNRNYGFKWGYDNIGSSNTTNSDTYRGSAAFSEPEIQMIRDFDSVHQFKIALNYHTYGGYIVYPWGYLASYLTPDSNFFGKAGAFLTEENRYIYGTGDITVGYTTNGDSDDWGYGEQTTKGKIYSMTPEVGLSFWDPATDIIDICRKNLNQNLQAARLLLPRATVHDNNPIIFEKDSGYLSFGITRLGLPDSINYTLTVTPLTNSLHLTTNSNTYANMQLAETRNDSFKYVIDTTGRTNNMVIYVVAIAGGGVAYSDTFVKYYGDLTLVFNEPCTNLNQWNASTISGSGGWGVDSSHYYSAPSSFDDSPNGSYQAGSTVAITTKNTIDLVNASQAFLTFRGRWDLETSFDYSQVLVSTDGGSTWTAQCGQYTHSGGLYQAAGEPLYDGHQLNWLPETIDLGDYLGQKIQIRFQTVSDQAVQFDGFAFDDLKVWVNDKKCLGLTSTIQHTYPSTLYSGQTTELHAVVDSGATYQWNQGGSPVMGATDSVYGAQGGNYYTLTTIYPNGCKINSDSVFLPVLLSIANINGSNGLSASISPNPFANNLSIQVASVRNENAVISIKDLLGRELLNKNWLLATGNNQFNWQLGQMIVNGLYLFTIQTEEGVFVQKIVKQ